MLGSLRIHFRQRVFLLAVVFVPIFCILGFFVFVHPVGAQTELLQQLGDATLLPQTNIILIIARIIRVVLGLLGILMVILIMYAGYLYMISQGEQAKTERAKKIITQAIIGFAIIMSSFIITTFVINAILKAAGGQVDGQSNVQKYTEPLSGALGAGIIENHYPARNAQEIPRNTKIFITFKEPIEPASIIQGYKTELANNDPNQSTALNENNMWIFPTQDEETKLTADEVTVKTDETFTTFVFDPIDLLGDEKVDTNYSVSLQTGIKTKEGKNAFVGKDASGYEWTFEVSTVVDLTPPKVVSKIPPDGSLKDRNITVELTFNEAMDPISSTGSYDLVEKKSFTNMVIVDENGDKIQGTYEISNNYRTVGFKSNNPCAEDPCGDTIYCLPGGQELDVTARAASIDPVNPPQAQPIGIGYDGLTDAAGNSLDGDGDGKACGSQTDGVACENGAVSDDYAWGFSTTNEINVTVPKILALNPEVNGQNIDPNAPVEAQFNTLMLGSSVKSANASLWPDPLYPNGMWFVPSKTDDVVGETSTLSLNHPAFISNADGGHEYYPVWTHGLKSSYQICMYPSTKVGGVCSGSNPNTPYCCQGIPSDEACTTLIEGGVLPGNIK